MTLSNTGKELEHCVANMLYAGVRRERFVISVRRVYDGHSVWGLGKQLRQEWCIAIITLRTFCSSNRSE